MVGRTPLVALFLSLSTLTPDTTVVPLGAFVLSCYQERRLWQRRPLIRWWRGAAGLPPSGLSTRTAAPVQTSLVFHGDNGSPLSLPLTVTQPASSQQVTESTVNEAIAPNTTLVVATGTPAGRVGEDRRGASPLVEPEMQISHVRLS